MFLRSTKRFKDGKVHYYWSMVENVRVGRRVFQRQALYLGELNDSQREEWQRAIEALDEKGNVRQLKLFPEDRAPETDDGRAVRIRMDRLAVTPRSEPQGDGLACAHEGHRPLPLHGSRERTQDAHELAREHGGRGADR